MPAEPGRLFGRQPSGLDFCFANGSDDLGRTVNHDAWRATNADTEANRQAMRGRRSSAALPDAGTQCVDRAQALFEVDGSRDLDEMVNVVEARFGVILSS